MSGSIDEAAPGWGYGLYPFKLCIGEFTLASVPVRLMRRSAAVSEQPLKFGESPAPPVSRRDAEGFAVWAHPVAEDLPTTSWKGDKIIYVPNQYNRYFIDLSGSYETYLGKFSAKSRSTLKRKLRKFRDLGNGEIHWREYRLPAEIQDFFTLARQVSKKTYQERLLDAGLPDDPGFVKSMRALAERDSVRAYLLFHDGEPVAYLYCPVHQGVLQYQYLGYLPSFAQHSPGTVLQSLALEALFKEGKYRLFDFTGGEGDHKRFFSTNSVRCADVFVFDRTLRLTGSVMLHQAFTAVSDTAGEALDRLGLKTRIRRILRRQ